MLLFIQDFNIQTIVMKLKFLLVLLLGLFTIHLHAQDVFKKRNGIIIVRQDSLLRALTAFSGSAKGGDWYAEAINAYKEKVGDSVEVYNMIVPLSSAFCWPQKYTAVTTQSQQATINHMYAMLNKDVHAINLWQTMEDHKAEPIYARTDHHWLPLGAYYAAEQFANVAQVPFKNLDHYEPRVVRNFVGSMTIFSGDDMLKQSPEEFTYFVPIDCPIQTTYVEHILKNRRVVGVKPAVEGNFFFSYKDGSRGAYSTFMGGDLRTTHVVTPTKNGRRLLIIKDSFGNALPAFLFFSFSDIYVVDFRYFQENILDYMKNNKVTDLLIVNNLQHAYKQATAQSLMNMLPQSSKN